MLTDAALAYLHYACILILAGALSAEALLLRASPGAATIAALVRADILYMIAAVLALASGAGRLLFGVKGMAFYVTNPWFHAKITLFVVIGLISIGPRGALFSGVDPLSRTPHLCRTQRMSQGPGDSSCWKCTSLRCSPWLLCAWHAALQWSDTAPRPNHAPSWRTRSIRTCRTDWLRVIRVDSGLGSH